MPTWSSPVLGRARNGEEFRVARDRRDKLGVEAAGQLRLHPRQVEIDQVEPPLVDDRIGVGRVGPRHQPRQAAVQRHRAPAVPEPRAQDIGPQGQCIGPRRVGQVEGHPVEEVDLLALGEVAILDLKPGRSTDRPRQRPDALPARSRQRVVVDRLGLRPPLRIVLRGPDIRGHGSAPVRHDDLERIGRPRLGPGRTWTARNCPAAPPPAEASISRRDAGS